jgi:hypothetical protein
LQPLEVTVFNPTYNNVRAEQTSLTVDGRLGWLKAVYTGGYLVRSVLRYLAAVRTNGCAPAALRRKLRKVIFAPESS